MNEIDVTRVVAHTSDEIFHEYSLVEVQRISEELEASSNEQKDKLRKLVASKYRDLLSTADEIIDMNRLCEVQDKKLYELSFFRSGPLTSNVSIELKLDRFMKVEEVNKSNREEVIQNSSYFLQLSKLLNLNDDSSWEFIIETVKNTSIESSWFIKRKQVLIDKLKELEMILINKLQSSDLRIDEISQIYSFLVDEFHSDLFKFDDSKIKQTILNKFINEVINKDNLSLILRKFPFKFELLKNYNNDIISTIDNLRNLVNEVNEDEKELKLYELDINNDDDYLLKIEYLNNGLIYPNYQQIDKLIKSTIGIMSMLKVIDDQNYQSMAVQLREIIDTFKTHAIEQENKSLLRYLSNITI